MAGTGCRYLVGELVRPWGAWPAATFLVNIVGAFLLGVLLEVLALRGPDVGGRRRWRLLAGTGFLGAFTTYSALAVDSVSLVRDGLPWLAVLYAAGSAVAGVVACSLGIWVAGRTPPDPAPRRAGLP
jgi:CrcB protein